MSDPGRDLSLFFTIVDPVGSLGSACRKSRRVFRGSRRDEDVDAFTVELQESAHWWVLYMWASKFCIWTEFRFRRGDRNCRLSSGDCFVMRWNLTSQGNRLDAEDMIGGGIFVRGRCRGDG